MYLQFFGLSETPFSITPDPAFVYLSSAHRDALAHLLYGVGKGGAGGFVQLTGEVGTGKTTICRCLLEQVPEGTRIALILNPLVTPQELLISICQELDIALGEMGQSNKALVDTLNAYLLNQHAQGRRVVVVIDEAQNLSPEALEQVRLLTNLETAKHKLLQMVLLGQPELRQLLQRQSLRQLAQRITARYHLSPLTEKETFAYVRHRMKVAGAQHNPFRQSALRALYQRSGGVPRLINIIADRALVGAYGGEIDQVNARLIHAAADEVQPSEVQLGRRTSPWLAAAASVMAMSALLFLLWNWQRPPQPDASSGPFEVATTVPEPKATPEPQGSFVAELPDSVTVIQSVPVVDMDTVGSAVTTAITTAPNLAVDNLPQAAAPRVAAVLEPDWLDIQNSHAWERLAALWHKQGFGEALRQACEDQSVSGFACLQDQGSWSKISRLGLPVILVLQQSGRRHVVLSGLDQERLLLGTGDDQRLLGRESVEPLWLGDYLVAWPQALDWPVQIRRGESGKAVDIVLQMAAMAEPPWQNGSGFDASFEAWLMSFQRQRGLVVDGIIGPKTLLYLMAPTITEPRLATLLDERF